MTWSSILSNKLGAQTLDNLQATYVRVVVICKGKASLDEMPTPARNISPSGNIQTGTVSNSRCQKKLLDMVILNVVRTETLSCSSKKSRIQNEK